MAQGILDCYLTLRKPVLKHIMKESKNIMPLKFERLLSKMASGAGAKPPGGTISIDRRASRPSGAEMVMLPIRQARKGGH